MVGGGQERGLRPGTIPVHLVAGFGAAARAAMTERSQRALRNRQFRERVLTAAQAARSDRQRRPDPCATASPQPQSRRHRRGSRHRRDEGPRRDLQRQRLPLPELRAQPRPRRYAARRQPHRQRGADVVVPPHAGPRLADVRQPTRATAQLNSSVPDAELGGAGDLQGRHGAQRAAPIASGHVVGHVRRQTTKTCRRLGSRVHPTELGPTTARTSRGVS